MSVFRAWLVLGKGKRKRSGARDGFVQVLLASSFSFRFFDAVVLSEQQRVNSGDGSRARNSCSKKKGEQRVFEGGVL